MKDTKIQWHPGFVAAMNLEFKENKKDLIFEKEHNLNTKPLEVDLLIIKKNISVHITNEIGAFFRGHNIIEYKSPKDNLDIDVFYKSLAYASLYKAYGKSVDERRADDITVSIVRESKPRELFRYFEEHGYTLNIYTKGVYYIEGNTLFPTQIIVTGELNKGTHTWLRALSENLQKEDIQKLLVDVQGLTERTDQEMADSVLEISLTANKQILQELIGDGSMYEALMEIMEPQLVLRDEAMMKEGMQKGMQKGMQRGIQKGEFETLYGLVCDNLITLESAAARKNMTVNEFQAKLRELDIK